MRFENLGIWEEGRRARKKRAQKAAGTGGESVQNGGADVLYDAVKANSNLIELIERFIFEIQASEKDRTVISNLIERIETKNGVTLSDEKRIQTYEWILRELREAA